MSACFCIGPQDGQPECLCAMRNVSVINGRFVRMQDIGPAPDTPISIFLNDATKKAIKDAIKLEMVEKTR